MHSLPGGSAAVRCYHVALFIFVEHNAKLVQPLNSIRCFHYESAKKFRPCGKMAAAKRIQIMLYRRIILLVRSLNAALCHHCVRIANAQLCHNHNICACLMSLDCSRGTCASASDDKDIHIIIHFIQVDFFVQQTAV